MKNKFELKVKNYKSIEDISINLIEGNTRLIAIAGNNNTGKSSILAAIKKMSGNLSILKEDIRTIMETKNHRTRKINLMPEISINFLYEENKDNKKTSSYFLEAKLKNEQYHEPSILNDPRNFISKRIDKLMREITSYEETYQSVDAFIHSFETFSNNNWYYQFKNRILSLKDDSFKKKILQIGDELNAQLQIGKMKKQINVFEIDTFNIFSYSKMNLNLLYENNSEKEKELKAIKIWEQILSIDFKDLLFERAKESNETNKSKIVENFQIKANALMETLEKSFFGGQIHYYFRISLSLNHEDFALLVSLEKRIPSENFPEYITWDEDVANQGEGVKWLWSIIFRLNSININEPILIVIDEPEKNLNHIHQNLLLKYFKSIMSNNTERKNQILIYATHSPFMFDLDLYQNLYIAERDLTTNSSVLNNVYNVRGKEVPNLLLDKNFEVRFIEANFISKKSNTVIFVEGITDYFSLKTIYDDAFYIPLFGTEFVKTLSFHLPYVLSYAQNIKVIVDSDSTGKDILKWLRENTNLCEDHLKTYSDFFAKKINLEEAILDPWFESEKENLKKLGIEKTNDKKINSIIFSKHFKKNNLQNYQNLLKFLMEKS